MARSVATTADKEQSVSRGIRRVCSNGSCRVAYYDLGRAEISCPACETVYDPLPLLRSSRGRGSRATARPVEVEAEATTDGEGGLDKDVGPDVGLEEDDEEESAPTFGGSGTDDTDES